MNKVLKTAVLTAVFVMAGVFTALAQVKTIQGLTVKCSSRLEAGSILSEAVFDDTGSGEGDVNVTLSTENCMIEDYSLSGSGSRFLGVGDKVKVKLLIVPTDPEYYRFNGTYSSSSIKVSGGTFVSCSVKNGELSLTFTLPPITGNLEAPYDASWKNASASSGTSAGPGSSSSSGNGKISVKNIGKAVWTAPENTSGYYDVSLYRGSSLVHKFTDIKGKTVDCYPYMTKKGTYYFKVRTVPHTEENKKYAKPSEWVESDEFYLEAEYVSDGTGQEVGSTQTVGWVKAGDIWYYRYPDGNLKKNGWEKISGKWYLFDKDGKMLTGKQTIQSGTYYMAPSGEMLTGWQKVENVWYFFNNQEGADTEGMMYQNAWLTEPDGKTYYLNDKGIMTTGWAKIGEFWYHFDQSGLLSRNTVIDTFRVNEEGIWVQ